MLPDNQIFQLIDREYQRQKKGIELIASENFVSEEVMPAMASSVTTNYQWNRLSAKNTSR